MTAAWIGMVAVQVVVTLVLGLIVGSLRWTVARVVAQNDRDHGATDARIDALTAALGSEKDARHAAVAEVASDLAAVREDRPRRGEIVTHYVALSQKVGDLGEKVAGLSALIQEQRRQP